MREELASLLAQRGEGPAARAGAVVTRVEMTDDLRSARSTCACSKEATIAARRRAVVDALRRAPGHAAPRGDAATAASAARPSFASSTTTGVDDIDAVEQLLDGESTRSAQVIGRALSRLLQPASARHVPGAAPGGHLADGERAGVAVDDEGEARAVHDPEGLLPAMAPAASPASSACPSSSETNCARSSSWWLREQRATALRNGAATRFSHSLPGSAASRVASQPSRGKTMSRREIAGRPARWPRAGAARAPSARRSRSAGSRRPAGAASTAASRSRPVGARRSRRRRSAPRRTRRRRAVPCTRWPRAAARARRPRRSQAQRLASRRPHSRQHRKRDQVHVEDLVERLDLREARLGRPRQQPELRARRDAALEDRVRDLLDVDAVPLEHRRARWRTSPPCPSSG